jgi:hypothetical protein
MLFLRYALWIAPNLLILVILVRFVRSGLKKRLPLFFTYLVYQLLEFIVLLGVNLLPFFSFRQYQWAYVFGQGIASILKFAIVTELADDLLASRSALAATLEKLLRWVAAALLLAGATGSALLFRSDLARVESVFNVLNLWSNLVLAGLLVFLFLFGHLFSIAWRGFSAGVALGFGIFASVELATASARAQSVLLDSVNTAAYLVCVLVWLGYMFFPEKGAAAAEAGLKKADLEIWEQDLGRMVRR